MLLSQSKMAARFLEKEPPVGKYVKKEDLYEKNAGYAADKCQSAGEGTDRRENGGS